jgi:nucleotide-binding universal stress UspA family protein
MTYQIVAGVDGSKHSRAALLWALDEAQCHSGEVTALFAWQVPFLSFPGAFDREELEQASKEADLLVLGIRGRSPFAGLLLGSVSQGAAATASCPVVLVKLTDRA